MASADPGLVVDRDSYVSVVSVFISYILIAQAGGAPAMNRTYLKDLISPQLTNVTLTWPYLPRRGGIARTLPLDEVACR